MLKQKSFNHCKNDKITCLSKCYWKLRIISKSNSFMLSCTRNHIV